MVEIIVEVWIWHRCQNRKPNYDDGEQLLFYKKVHIKTQSKKKDVLVIFIWLGATIFKKCVWKMLQFN